MAMWTDNLRGKNFGICFNFGDEGEESFTLPYQQDLELPQGEAVENEETISWKPQYKGDMNTSYTTTSKSQKYTGSFSCFYDPYNASFQKLGQADMTQKLVYFSIVNTDMERTDPKYTIAFGACTIKMGTTFPLEGQNTIDVDFTVQGAIHRIGINEKLTIKYVVGNQGKKDQDQTFEGVAYGTKTPTYSMNGRRTPEPEYASYTFSHWAKDEATKNDPTSTVDPFVYGDVTYNAIFKKK